MTKEKKFTVDEIKIIFQHRMNDTRMSYNNYTTLDGKNNKVNIKDFAECMDCFLKDLQLIADDKCRVPCAFRTLMNNNRNKVFKAIFIKEGRKKICSFDPDGHTLGEVYRFYKVFKEIVDTRKTCMCEYRISSDDALSIKIL